MSEALNRVDSAESLLKIKGLIALFIQTMDVRTSVSPEPIRSDAKVAEGMGLLG